MKWIWSLFLSTSRSRQIGWVVLCAHLLVVLSLCIHHLITFLPPITKPIAIRTLSIPREIAAPKPPPSARSTPPIPSIKPKPSLPKPSKETKKKSEAKAQKPKKTVPSPSIQPEETLSVESQLLEELQSSFEALSAPSTKAPKRANLSVPTFTPSQALIEETFTDNPSYAQEIAAILQSSLDLPEFGSVKAKLDISALGTLISCEILDAKSQKNSLFLKKRLQELSFPCFNGFGIVENHLEITVTFTNVENP